ncbi:MAG: hypothetical protein WCI49_14030 [Ferruginibacter sp.]
MITLQSDILKTLAYFDIFHYPLKNEEVRNFLSREVSQQLIDEQLTAMTEADIIYKIDEFYALHNDLFMVVRRRNGNKNALAAMQNAVKATKILSAFPFVEGLALSGSLSKNYADENTDIDFFIITRSNRLWIARTLMHIFYRFAKLAGKRDWFCMNYYIDETALEIEEKNIYTAIEIVTLIPMQGAGTVQAFMNENNWTKNYLPAYRTPKLNAVITNKGLIRKLLEVLLGGKVGNAIDNWLLQTTQKRWIKKEEQKNINAKGICMGMIAGKHFAKPDPENFQDKILAQYREKTNQFAVDYTNAQALAGQVFLL